MMQCSVVVETVKQLSHTHMNLAFISTSPNVSWVFLLSRRINC